MPTLAARPGRFGTSGTGTHVPIMVNEVLTCLRPEPGHTAVDCTLGGGGHAAAILGRLLPGGRLVGLDLDRDQLSRTDEMLRGQGFGPDVVLARAASFADLRDVLTDAGIDRADLVLADLGVSSMQLDDPARGFSYKTPGPLDMRMDRSRGESASALLARIDESSLAALLHEHADEPHAALIARLLKAQRIETTHALERIVRAGLNTARPDLDRAAVKLSVRRVFQALRIAVNDEYAALDALLRALPLCLAPGGRVAILTFHSGEDRRVKQAFRDGARGGIYSEIAGTVVRSTVEELRANRRAQAAKLRWAVRAVD